MRPCRYSNRYLWPIVSYFRPCFFLVYFLPFASTWLFIVLARFYFFYFYFFLNFFSARYRPWVSKRFFIQCHVSFMNLVWPRFEFLFTVSDLVFLISIRHFDLPFFFLLICVRTKVKKQINLFGSFLCLLNLYAYSKRNLDNIIFVKIKKIKIPKFLNIDEERRLQLSQAFLSPRNDQEFKDFLRY